MTRPPKLRIPSPRILLATIALAGVVLAGAFLLLNSGSGDEAPSAVVATTPTATPSPQLTPTETPPPPPPAPPPNRADCLAIAGTPFESEDEAAWFAVNCANLDAPAVAATAGQVPIGDRLIVPGAGIDTSISRVTVPTDGQMPDPVGYFLAVWYDFSRFPGFGGYVNAGNLILAGHVDCAHCINGGSGTAVFWSIRNLKPGDTAEYDTADGRSIKYVVTASRSYSPSADWDQLLSSSAADMTLITCTGTFSGGDYSLRHVVSLKKV